MFVYKLTRRLLSINMTQEVNNEQCNKYLNEAWISIQGSKEKLNNKISKFKKHQDLWKKLKARAQKAHQFIYSFNPNDIPGNSRAWKNEPVLHQLLKENFKIMQGTKMRVLQGNKAKLIKGCTAGKL